MTTTDRVTLYHGTTWKLSEIIETEGLRKTRPMSFIYVTEHLDQAEAYAHQRAEDRFDMPVVVVIEVDAATLDDPEHWSHGAGAGHWLTSNDVPATAIVDIWEAEAQ